MTARLRGLIAATHTPMLDDERVDLDRIPVLVEHLLRQPIDGLYALGSTGEAPSLTTDERRAVAEAFVRAVAGRRPVVVQVGHTALHEARALAQHAAATGADAISAVFTSYYPVRDLDAAVDALAGIAASAPDTPFYAYHIPALSGSTVDAFALLRRLAERVPNLAGLKFTAPQIHEFQACVDGFGDRLDLLFGCDEMLLSGLVAGAHGAIGSTYSFAAPLYRRVLAALERGDLDAARAAQARAVALVRVLVRHGGAPAIKATMALTGCDCGPVRAPQRPLDRAAHEALRVDLERLGFFAWLDDGA